MLQKIVFQDNIFQLARSIDTLNEGLMLDLSFEYFFDKTIDDLLFFDASIQKLFLQIQSNTQLSEYITLLHSLYSCQNSYIQVLNSILGGNTALKDDFHPLFPKLKGIRDSQVKVQAELVNSIQKSDKNNDSHDIVSQNELSELLHF